MTRPFLLRMQKQTGLRPDPYFKKAQKVEIWPCYRLIHVFNNSRKSVKTKNPKTRPIFHKQKSSLESYRVIYNYTFCDFAETCEK